MLIHHDTELSPVGDDIDLRGQGAMDGALIGDLGNLVVRARDPRNEVAAF